MNYIKFGLKAWWNDRSPEKLKKKTLLTELGSCESLADLNHCFYKLRLFNAVIREYLSKNHWVSSSNITEYTRGYCWETLGECLKWETKTRNTRTHLAMNESNLFLVNVLFCLAHVRVSKACQIHLLCL